uniref:U-box domain-containing protein n=1 Tax=Nelumbo nucifera TaxID=4432 RepID=A0A822Z4I4_NELNU|nr:TPA_asm: hypothetical protein HUJ06_008970 [Nelumbo nucifera]
MASIAIFSSLRRRKTPSSEAFLAPFQLSNVALVQMLSIVANEIEFLEEHIYNNEGDVDPTVSVLNGFLTLTRYCRFLLFGFEEEEEMGYGNQKKVWKGLIYQEIGETFLTIPKDFCCPISLDLMRDPVIISME